MSNDVLDCLIEDHGRFERLFKAIELQCVHLESGQPAGMPKLRAIVTYLRGYAFPCHHALEDAVFTQLEKRLPHFRTEIFDLLEDHQSSEHEFESLVRAVDLGNGTLSESARSFIANERGTSSRKKKSFFPTPLSICPNINGPSSKNAWAA